MKIILSPAKRLSIQEFSVSGKLISKPVFVEKSQILIDILKQKTVNEIQDLMNLSNDLALLNSNRYLNWKKNHSLENSIPAIKLFYGDAYRGLDAKTLSSESLLNLNDKLLILSGLYGILRPFDLIQEHRLEMGTKLENPYGNNLYKFWQDTVTGFINNVFENDNNKILINLASNEYFKVINKKQLKADIVTPVFKENKDGKYKTIAIHAKRARGLMTRFIVENNIEDIEHLKAFDYENYYFSKEMSSTKEYVFIRG